MRDFDRGNEIGYLWKRLWKLCIMECILEKMKKFGNQKTVISELFKEYCGKNLIQCLEKVS